MLKYVHVFVAFNRKGLFYKTLLDVINNPDYGFNIEDQLFIVLNEDLYNIINGNKYDNVILFPYSEKSYDAINYYGDKCEWLFVHGMTNIMDSFRIKSKYRGKIIWRTWGHDTGLRYIKGDIKNAPRFFINSIYRYIVRSYYAVGIANSSIDRKSIRMAFGDVRTLCLPYSSKSKLMVLNRLNIEPNDITTSFNIVLGHSGLEQEHHIIILNMLERFSDNDIKIYIPLMYGKVEYIDSIVSGIDRNLWGDKVVILRDYMQYEDYVRFLKKMDLAIIDGLGSAALGNISILRYFSKRLCVNRKGIIHQSLNEEDVPHLTIDELSHISYEELISPVKYTEEQRAIPRDPVELWQEAYDTLESEMHQ